MSFLSRLPVAVVICGVLGTFIKKRDSRDRKRTEKLSDSEQTQQQLEDKGKCQKGLSKIMVQNCIYSTNSLMSYVHTAHSYITTIIL